MQLYCLLCRHESAFKHTRTLAKTVTTEGRTTDCSTRNRSLLKPAVCEHLISLDTQQEIRFLAFDEITTESKLASCPSLNCIIPSSQGER
jgi:hypothetical protein